jgi:uncharacterized surface protein with fasciclin (FAS1) repeats
MFESGGVTVFAPPDSAIDGLPPEVLTDPAVAAEFVDAHVVDGALDVTTLETQRQVTTRGGQVLTISGGTITLPDGGQVSITSADEAATNGFVHEVSGVLFVPDVTPSTTAPTAQPASS